MYFISVTRLRVKSLIYLPRFLLGNAAVLRSIKKIEGFICGKELVDKGFTFWTVTLWESDQAMKYFRNRDPHQSAMRNLPGWCDEGAYVHWIQEEAVIPDWNLLYKKLITEGKTTKVKQPSTRQEGMKYPAPLWTRTERKFKSLVK
jgi:hypothetical protein